MQEVEKGRVADILEVVVMKYFLLAVIVSPHGMSGRLTGCSPSDLVKQVYFRYILLTIYYKLTITATSFLLSVKRLVEHPSKGLDLFVLFIL